MVVTSRTRFHFAGKCSSDDHPDVWILAHELRRRAGARYDHQRVGIAPATQPINIVTALHQSRCAFAALVAVVAADVDPLQSIWRPGSAPAAVVGGVGVGRAKERKAMEAMMEEAVMEAVPERDS